MTTCASLRRLAAALALLVLSSGCEKEETIAPPAVPVTAVPSVVTIRTGIEMVRIPAGEFLMGDDHGEDDERPVRRVHLRAFYMDKHEVTQQAYEGLMKRNPSKFKAPSRPVEQMDWYHAVLYCNMRSLREGLTPCYDPKTLKCDFTADGYRLPTEAEWEYACRAGTTTQYSFGDAAAELRHYAWLKDNAGQSTQPVGRKRPNRWGLYDMHGNVAEWCNDFYGEGYGGTAGKADPRGPASGDECVLRGGSWRTSAERCRCAARGSETPRFADACFGSDAYGFRCVRKAE